MSDQKLIATPDALRNVVARCVRTASGEMPVDAVLDALDRGLMADAKTIIALQWYKKAVRR